MGIAAACVENRCGRIFRRGTVGARPSKPVYLPPVEFSRDNRIYFVSYRNFTSPESSRRTRSHAILVPRIAEIYLYDPLKVPLPREINSYVFEYIFILSSPSFFPRSFFFYQTHHLSSNLPFTLLELTLLPPVELQRNFWIASRPIPSTLLPLYFSSAGVDRPG